VEREGTRTAGAGLRRTADGRGAVAVVRKGQAGRQRGRAESGIGEAGGADVEGARLAHDKGGAGGAGEGRRLVHGQRERLGGGGRSGVAGRENDRIGPAHAAGWLGAWND